MIAAPASARPAPDGYLSTSAVAERIGVPFEVLDRWVRAGVIDPAVDAAGSGTRRCWSVEQLPALHVVGKVWQALREWGGAGSRLALPYGLAAVVYGVAEEAYREGRQAVRVELAGGADLYVELPGAFYDPDRCGVCAVRLPDPDDEQLHAMRLALLRTAHRTVDGLRCFCVGNRTGQEIPERRDFCARHWFLDRIAALIREFDGNVETIEPDPTLL